MPGKHRIRPCPYSQEHRFQGLPPRPEAPTGGVQTRKGQGQRLRGRALAVRLQQSRRGSQRLAGQCNRSWGPLQQAPRKVRVWTRVWMLS